METITDRVAIHTIIRERPQQLKGFTVRTIDGEAGKVAPNQDDVDDLHLVVHIQRLFGLLGADVVIEAEAIDQIDPGAQEIHVNRITDWVLSSPKLGTLTG